MNSQSDPAPSGPASESTVRPVDVDPGRPGSTNTLHEVLLDPGHGPASPSSNQYVDADPGHGPGSTEDIQMVTFDPGHLLALIEAVNAPPETEIERIRREAWADLFGNEVRPRATAPAAFDESFCDPSTPGVVQVCYRCKLGIVPGTECTTNGYHVACDRGRYGVPRWGEHCQGCDTFVRGARPNRKWCSLNCAARTRRSMRRAIEVSLRARRGRTCEFCGADLPGTARPEAKYCNDACRKRGNRAKAKAARLA